jgi:AcrR family transcriptional regulator
MPPTTTNQDTCERLLAAAIEVFTAVGYREATLRAICQRAGANSAAVNYHFHDKQHLYLAVIEQAIEAAQVHSPLVEDNLSTGPEDRLRVSIQGILTHLLSPGPTNCLMKLVAWELAEPTAGLDLVIKKAIAPFDAELGAIVRELAGPSITAEEVEDCVSSIVA